MKNIEKTPQTEYLSDEEVLKLIRYEISAQDLFGDAKSEDWPTPAHEFIITAEDLLRVLKKANGMKGEQFQNEWLFPVMTAFDEWIELGATESPENEGYRYLPNEKSVVRSLLEGNLDFLNENATMRFGTQIKALEAYIEDRKKPVPERHYTDEQKLEYIKSYNRFVDLGKRNDDEIRLFIRFVNELVEKSDYDALKIKADLCYKGDSVIKRDWATARDCFFKLIKEEGNPDFYEALGQIYYSGELNDGVPEYDKAFYYFSIGAAGGNYESRYMLADMLRFGQGVMPNRAIATGLLREIYYENLKIIFDGCFDCKFPEIAYRYGEIMQRNLWVTSCYDEPLHFYLQADFALRQRMIETKGMWDKELASDIKRGLNKDYNVRHKKGPALNICYSDLDEIIRFKAGIDRLWELNAKLIPEGNEYALKLRLLQRPDEDFRPKIFFTSPEAQFCGFLDELKIKTKGLRAGLPELKTGVGTLSHPIVFNEVDEDGKLLLFGEMVGRIEAMEFEVKLLDYRKAEKHQFVLVDYVSLPDEHTLICEIPDIKVGSTVAVETPYGLEEAIVTKTYEKYDYESAIPLSYFKHVVKKIK